MKEGWKELALKEIGITQTGTTPSKSVASNYGDFIPFIRPSEIDFDGSGSINYNSDMKLSESGLSNGRLFKKNSIFMVCIGTIGKVGFSTIDVSCNQQINVLTPNKNHNFKFVYYALRNKKFQDEVIKIAKSSQATLPIISKGKWEILKIAVPSLDEQERIVEYLDKAFEDIDTLKDNSQKQLDDARKLFQAALTEAMQPKEGWEEKTLKDIVNKDCPISYGIVQQGDHITGGIPVVRPVDLCKKYVHKKGLKCTEKSISNKYKRTILRGIELLLSVRGTTGVISLASAELKGCNVNRGIVPLFFKELISRDFIYYEMTSPQMQKVFLEKTTGSTLKQINIKALREIHLYIPPFNEQQEIVQKLDALSDNVQKLEEINRKVIAECDALKQSILRQIFE